MQQEEPRAQLTCNSPQQTHFHCLEQSHLWPWLVGVLILLFKAWIYSPECLCKLSLGQARKQRAWWQWRVCVKCGPTGYNKWAPPILPNHFCLWNGVRHAGLSHHHLHAAPTQIPGPCLNILPERRLFHKQVTYPASGVNLLALEYVIFFACRSLASTLSRLLHPGNLLIGPHPPAFPFCPATKLYSGLQSNTTWFLTTLAPTSTPSLPVSHWRDSFSQDS